MAPRSRRRGDSEVRLERVAGVAERSGGQNDESCWFAFRRPRDWLILDLERRNGELFVGEQPSRRGLLIVDGRTAVEGTGGGPGYRRFTAMVEQGFPVWDVEPDDVVEHSLEGRATETLTWHRPEGDMVASYDVATGLCVQTVSGEREVLCELRFDSDVPDDVFDIPELRADWRGGDAFITEEMDGTGRYSAAWQPTSGPGCVEVRGPKNVAVTEAIAWARQRADRLFQRDAVGSPREI